MLCSGNSTFGRSRRHNNPVQADLQKILVGMKRLLAAAQPERYLAFIGLFWSRKLILT
ncbi:MAG: hypothetical protein AAFZ49_05265 [Cyanobacteria bacterium J06659_2]